MAIGLPSYGAGLLAGALSTLSPCVLPLVPIVLGTASTAHRYGPLALAGGLSLSFAVLGTALAYFGTVIGLPPNLGRDVGAVLLGIFGVVLLSGFLQGKFAAATAGIGSRADGLLTKIQPTGLSGQVLVGAVLGLVWSPCAGPTLGAAIGLASQGREIGPIMLLMGLFGIGASLPLLAVGWLGRRAMGAGRGTLLRAGQVGKMALGGTFVVIAAALLTGYDQHLEAWLVQHSPDWLTALTTRY